MTEMEAHLAESVAEQLRDDEPLVEDAEVRENHHGPFVFALCTDNIAYGEMRSKVEEYPVWVELEVA